MDREPVKKKAHRWQADAGAKPEPAWPSCTGAKGSSLGFLAAQSLTAGIHCYSYGRHRRRMPAFLWAMDE